MPARAVSSETRTAIAHQSSHRAYGSIACGAPRTTITGRQPPAAPSATNSVIFGVDTKSPGALRQKRCDIAASKYLGAGRLRVAAAISAASSVKLT